MPDPTKKTATKAAAPTKNNIPLLDVLNSWDDKRFSKSDINYFDKVRAIKAKEMVNSPDYNPNDRLYLTKKGNELTKGQWGNMVNNKTQWGTPSEYVDYMDNWATPSDSNVAEIAAKSFQNTPNAVANQYPTTQGIDRGMNGSYSTYTVSPAQNRAIDSTAHVNKYYLDNKLKPPVLSPQERLALMNKMKNNGGI